MTIYATLEDIKTYLRIPIDSAGGDNDDDDLLSLCLQTASRAIEQACGRDFLTGATVVSARYFTATRERFTTPVDVPDVTNLTSYTTYVDIPDVTDLTGLVVESDQTGNGTYTTFTNYTMLPQNAPAASMPYRRIRFDGSAPVVRDGACRVSARWGWTAVPDTIKLATLMQAARLFKRRDAPFGIAGSAEWGTAMRMLPKLDPDVHAMLAPYRHTWWVA